MRRVGVGGTECWVEIRLQPASGWRGDRACHGRNLGKSTAHRRTATIMVAAERSLEFGLVRRGVVMHLPKAAGMRRLGRRSQRHRSKRAHQQQHQQRSGSETVHGRFLGRLHVCVG